jgi:sigma-B regulation protein RsbU (phosphoserine phosphatase)
LEGRGCALGIDGDVIYEENEPLALPKASVIFLSTDGLWEIRNQSGEMLGKKPIWDTIQDHSASSAGQILDGIMDRVSRFVGGAKIEDDITLVVVKTHVGSH